MQIRIFGHYSK